MTARALNIPHAKGQAAKKAPSPVAKAVKGALSWDLSKSITPLKDVGQLFVRTLALVFHQAGLLPRNYPGIFNDGRPRFMAVVGDAYRNIVWARENTLQILFFFSVVGFMFCTLMVAGLTAAGFVFGSAHAQSNGGFFVNKNDLGVQILDYIFLAKPITMSGQFGKMEGISEGIRWMFGFYSKAMLVFAAVILLYLLVGMIAETAHEGVTLGKRANQIWAPVRLVVAIGLLVPVGDTLSSGQAVVIQTARWGSQLASNVWETFLDKYYASGTVKIQMRQLQDLTPQAYQLTLNFICKHAWNSTLNASGQNPQRVTEKYLDGGPSYNLTTANLTDGKICGGVRYYDAVTAALYAGLEENAERAAIDLVRNSSLSNVANRPSAQSLIAAVAAVYKLGSNEITIGMEDKGDISQAKQYGWVAAGAHFLQRVVGLASETSLSDAKLPNVFGPEFMNYDPQVLGLPEDAKLFQQIKTKYNRAKAALDVIVAQGLSTRFDATDFAKDLRTGAVGNNGKTITNMLFILIDAALAYKGVWKYGTGDGLKLGVWVDSSVNPLAQFIAFGIAWVHGCLELIGMGLGIQAMAAAGAAGAAAAGAGNLIGVNMLGGVLSLSAATAKALGGLISFIGTVGLIGGVLVAFLAPLQPFLKFLFNTLTWVLGVFEAVLAVPLIAIAHLNPEGNGLPGQNARQAYFLVLNIFLRPVLMVFGLCFGILLFTIGVGLLNLLYETAGSISFSAGGPQTTSLLAFAVLTKIMMTVIYLITIYIMSNGCWKGIDYLPTQALRWMGQGAVQLEKMGDANQISQGVNTAGVFFGNQLVSQAGQVISGGEQGLSAAGRSLGSDFSGVGRWVMRPGQ